jgi:1,4-alpha-glucan branching enzyme
MREEKPLHELDFDPAGFSWIDITDAEQSVISFMRRSSNDELIIAVFNFTPVPRHNYQIGVPLPGRWLELVNSDAPIYGGSGQGNLGGVDAAPIGKHGHLHSVTLTLPPLGAIFLKPDPGSATGK